MQHPKEVAATDGCAAKMGCDSRRVRFSYELLTDNVRSSTRSSIAGHVAEEPRNLCDVERRDRDARVVVVLVADPGTSY